MLFPRTVEDAVDITHWEWGGCGHKERNIVQNQLEKAAEEAMIEKEQTKDAEKKG